jgi:hypothetical protein
MKRVVSVISERSYKPVDTTVRWAVANETSLTNWWLDPAYSSWNLMVMTNKVCDTGHTNSRGRNYEVSKSLWGFIDQLNTPEGRKYCRSVGRQICNRPWMENGIYHDVDAGPEQNDPGNADKFMNAEPVCYQPNPYKIIDETPTHYRVDAYYRGMDFSTLDPKIHNWITEPWKIVKCSSENRQGKVFNVMNGIDAFWITLCHSTGAWIPKNELVLAPDPTKYVIHGQRGVGYRLVGSHWIMGLENGEQVYVRRVTKNEGIKEYYGWHLNARSVVPPAWFQ